MKIKNFQFDRHFLASIEPERKFVLDSIEKDETDKMVSKILCGLNHGPPILVLINSDGGSLMDGLKLCDCFKISPSPVIGLVIGRAVSAALIALQGCSHRLATPHARLLVHEPFDEPEIKISRDTDIASVGRFLKGKKEQIALRSEMMTKLFSQIMKMPMAQTREFIKEERIIFPTEAKRLGLIDKVINL